MKIKNVHSLVLITRKLKKREKDASAQQRKERKNGEKMYHTGTPLPPPLFSRNVLGSKSKRKPLSLPPPRLTI